MKLILASASPRRRELLAALVGEFEVVASDIDEPFSGDAVRDARELALAKAAHVAAQFPNAIVIGADTIVFDETKAYGKPDGPGDAVAMIRDLCGRDHRVATGIAVVSGSGHASDVAVSTVTLEALDDPRIARYVASGVPLDKAGAYAIQNDEFPVVARLDGCYCNVVGLPLWRLKALLEAARFACDDPGRSYDRCAACPDRPAPP